MERFIVSARKYRPDRFDAVVGQEAITATLRNAIRSSHIAQAFLFCGPRGVGKTTCARILAKTINCESITPEGEACNECSSCSTFNQGRSLNIFELDAASNNHVDDIRSLIEQVRFPPQAGQYKVYIIDEVHMLSAAAFNAFLKTLEEPPAHARFILATTEKQKVIPTILSRCQIFDFQRLTVDDIARHLEFVARSEGITAESEALHTIAQKADGSLRDALSVFDRVVSFAGSDLTYKAVIDNLNILDYDYYFRVTGLLCSGDVSSALLTFSEIVQHGFDGRDFIGGLNAHIRNLLVSLDPATVSLLEVSPKVKERYVAQGAECGASFLVQALDIGNTCDIQYKASRNQRLHAELALIKMAGLSAPGRPAAEQPKQEATSVRPSTPAAPPAAASAPPPKPAPAKATMKAPPAATTPPSAPAGNVKAAPQTVSISEIMTGKSVPGKAEAGELAGSPVTTEMPKAEFTQADLLLHWKSYAIALREKGRVNLFATLTRHEPALKEDFTVELTIDNVAQEEEVAREKGDLLAFLRKKLGNYHVQLVTVLSEKEADDTPYTSKDKYDKMAKKNPSINKLKQQLDLDIEY